jgi:heat-inducible transcriptional repressor
MIANMIDLTARQVQILRAIIEEFVETAEPVGSDTIDKKFNIGVSPATIRNEMVYLQDQDYLKKSHASAGRIPTSKAMKLYVNELMKEKELSVADEVSAKEKIWKSRDVLGDLLYETTRVLADKSHALSVAITDDRKLYQSGFANLLGMPEFYDIDVTRRVLQVIEEVSVLDEIFDFGANENPIQITFGTDLNNRHLDAIGAIYMKVKAGPRICKLGVIGSTRFDYPYIIPVMKYFKSLIEDLVTE